MICQTLESSRRRKPTVSISGKETSTTAGFRLRQPRTFSFTILLRTTRQLGFVLSLLLVAGVGISERVHGDDGVEAPPLTISWENSYLTIRGPFPGKELRTHYLEAYCRPGSTDRDWAETVIPHQAELLSAAADGSIAYATRLLTE